jgi:poly(A) polymerase
MDELERRLVEIRQQEELDAIRPELDGEEVMALLGIGPGRAVGEALAHLLEIRLDAGLIGKDEAKRRLLAWWKDGNPDRREGQHEEQHEDRHDGKGRKRR